ncbi:MAG: HIT family protein [Candidatus Woesearchaeota archaeon]
MVTEEELKNMSPEEIAKLQRDNCIFCRIISGEITAKVVYRDDMCTAFLDINPASFGHMLLVPNNHYQIMPQMSEQELAHLGRVAKHLSHAAIKSLRSKGIDSTTIFIANGAIAGQKASHVIIHIIPRKEGDGVDKLSPKRNALSEENIKQVSQALISRINSVFNINMKVQESRSNKDEQKKPEEKEQEHKKEDRDKNPEKDNGSKDDKQADEKENPYEKEEDNEKSKDDSRADLDKISRLFGA